MDNHTEQRQQWLRDLQQPTAREIAWDVLAVILGAALILVSAIAGG